MLILFCRACSGQNAWIMLLHLSGAQKAMEIYILIRYNSPSVLSQCTLTNAIVGIHALVCPKTFYVIPNTGLKSSSLFFPFLFNNTELSMSMGTRSWKKRESSDFLGLALKPQFYCWALYSGSPSWSQNRSLTKFTHADEEICSHSIF